MIRTIFFLIYLCVYFVFLFPKLWKITKLEKQGKISEMHNFINEIAQIWGRRLIHRTGSTVHVTGAENIPDGPVLFVSNHQGNFDIPLLLGFIHKPKSFIAKVELEKIPILSTWMKKIKCIFMDREDPRQALKSIKEGIEILKSGHSMVIFPEGTRSKGNEMAEFKKGSLRLATKSKVPIVPITINGSYNILETNKGIIKPATVHITVSSPIYTDHLTKEEENQLTDQVYNTIKSHL